MPGYLFTKLLDSAVETKGEGLESFFDENIYNATYQKVSQKMQK